MEASDDGDHVNVEDLKVVMNGMEEIIDRILGKVGIDAAPYHSSSLPASGTQPAVPALVLVTCLCNVHLACPNYIS